MVQVGLLEDNARIAKLCATMLQYAGYHVTVYEHPRECLDALLTEVAGRHALSSRSIITKQPDNLPIDVLILDLHLPDITGIEVLHSLRANMRTRSLPLIFCSAATPAEVASALSIAPRACFIEKPFTYQELVASITNVLQSTN